jgi:hypothetical protein
MSAVVQFLLPSGTACFVVHFTALSVDMCCYVMSMAGLMSGELEIFGKICLSIMQLDLLKKATINVVMASHVFGIE